MKRLPVVLGWLAVLAGLLAAADKEAQLGADKLPPAAAGVMSFPRDVEPLLAARCLSCHGPTKQRAGLRLDDGAAALKGGDAGAVIVPGDSARSRLVHAVAGLDPDLKMPPKGEPLTAAEVGRLRAWIDQGAKWPLAKDEGGRLKEERERASKHWAFLPVHRPTVPDVAQRQWVRTPIDAFVLARLEKEGITPSPEADRTTLIRRLSLDLLGLPPTPREVEAFLTDQKPDAYERLVDRLLASPHYGERWGRHWLDLARYADSNGYDNDEPRPHAWRYRHWVIDALNRDLPFDRFACEQLAGDLLPGAAAEQKVATGFHRNTPTNTEAGVDKEEFWVRTVADRLSTTAKVFLGLTLECAQCHDHKYDPFTQKEYYQLFAFFNSDTEVAVPTTQAQVLALGPTRPTHVLLRGDHQRQGVKVHPGTPAVLPPLPGQGTPRTRLDLARWVVGPANPLTARVTVNRVWHHLFGRGLVPTVEDFGTRGERPSHPELLDWLASELVAGWSQKALLKRIVLSSTYRQTSRGRPEVLERDPKNVLLAQQNRFRLEGEVIRDCSLAAGGLLSRLVSGPSIQPQTGAGADRYRRGLYLRVQRTVPDPLLTTFDAPDSHVTCTRRDRSNTPLQALTLLNDAAFLECAQALGHRILTERPGAAAERIRHAFRLCLAREPNAHELAVLAQLLQEQQALCRANAEGATALVGNRPPPVGVSVAEAAAWVGLARTLLNLDEFITRE